LAAFDPLGTQIRITLREKVNPHAGKKRLRQRTGASGLLSGNQALDGAAAADADQQNFSPCPARRAVTSSAAALPLRDFHRDDAPNDATISFAAGSSHRRDAGRCPVFITG
jgi:hypothetical protein